MNAIFVRVAHISRRLHARVASHALHRSNRRAHDDHLAASTMMITPRTLPSSAANGEHDTSHCTVRPRRFTAVTIVSDALVCPDNTARSELAN